MDTCNKANPRRHIFILRSFQVRRLRLNDPPQPTHPSSLNNSSQSHLRYQECWINHFHVIMENLVDFITCYKISKTKTIDSRIDSEHASTTRHMNCLVCWRSQLSSLLSYMMTAIHLFSLHNQIKKKIMCVMYICVCGFVDIIYIYTHTHTHKVQQK